MSSCARGGITGITSWLFFCFGGLKAPLRFGVRFGTLEWCPDACCFGMTVSADSVDWVLRRSVDLGQDWSTVLDVRCGMHDLAGLRLSEAELTRHAIKATGLA
jgi:hypothetical protein